jgi:hypothetical protein
LKSSLDEIFGTKSLLWVMSAVTPKADIRQGDWHVRTPQFRRFAVTSISIIISGL